MEQYFRLVELSRPGHQIPSFARKYEIKWVLEINDVLGEDDTVQYNFSRRNLKTTTSRVQSVMATFHVAHCVFSHTSRKSLLRQVYCSLVQ